MLWMSILLSICIYICIYKQISEVKWSKIKMESWNVSKYIKKNCQKMRIYNFVPIYSGPNTTFITKKCIYQLLDFFNISNWHPNLLLKNEYHSSIWLCLVHKYQCDEICNIFFPSFFHNNVFLKSPFLSNAKENKLSWQYVDVYCNVL